MGEKVAQRSLAAEEITDLNSGDHTRLLPEGFRRDRELQYGDGDELYAERIMPIAVHTSALVGGVY
jgi:hypothetical protein